MPIRVAIATALAAAVTACGPSGTPADCTDEQTACGEICTDTSSDRDHCGDCDVACGDGQACIDGDCTSVETCTPNATEPCYDGTIGTEDVGPCHAGTRTCSDDGIGFGPCVGQVTPVDEVCGNGEDEDCTGTADDAVDHDDDGWTSCDGDCCDSGGCSDPELVNPGAFEVDGNDVDDDCDGTTDNAVALCDSGIVSNSGNAMDYARAMDLCQTATEGGPLTEQRWGVISAELLRANGSGTPSANARAIRGGFGTGTDPQLGASVAMLSTGHAAAQTDATAPTYVAFQGGADNGLDSAVPSDWLGANGGNFPNAPGCPDPAGGTTGNDPIMLKLRIRAPSNARSFSLGSNFFSSEYPEWVCSAFNDFFVVLLDSSFTGQPANPTDKNLAIYTAPGGDEYPVGVNLAFGDTGLFTQCVDGPTGCGMGSVPGNNTACTSAAELAGTGMDVVNPAPHPDFGDEPGYCGSSNLSGGGTGWLVTSGNIVGGEVFELRLAIWDTGDPWYDSVVLLDNFQWSVDASEPGTVIP